MRVFQRFPPFLPYGVAIASTAVALLLSLWLQEIITQLVIGTFFYLAIVTSAWYGGQRPGIVVIALSALAISYYFIPPINQVYISDWHDVFRLVIFVSVGLMINTLTASLQESKRKLEVLNRRLAEESASRLRVALKAARMGMWDWNIVTGEITWSPEHEQLLGLSPGSFDGRYETFEAGVYPDDREALNQAISDSLQNRVPYYHEYRVVWADGSIHWVEGRGQAFYGETGQPVRMSGTLLSIDQRKQTELALQAREARLQRLASNIVGMLYQYVLQANGSERFTYVSAQCRNIYELEPDELLQDSGQSWSMIHPDDVKRVRQQKLNSAQHLDRFDTEFRLLPPSGVVRWVRAVSQPERLSNGDIVWDGLILDVTERKSVEAELRERERLFSTLAAALPVTVFRFDADNNCIFINDYWTVMTGRTTESVMGLTWVESLHPEDRDRLVQSWMEWSQGPGQRELYQNEGRLVHLDGRDIWYYIQALAEVDANGEIIGYIGVMTDITDRKRTEAALQEREGVLRLFVQYAPVGMAMFDQEMRYVMMSQQWLDNYYPDSPEFLIGRSHYEIFPNLPEYWKQVHQRCLAGATEKSDEDQFIGLDGNLQWTRWEVRPWCRADGEIGGIIIFAENINQRKLAESAVLELNQQLQKKVIELQTLLDVIPIGIGIAEDPECRHIQVNPAFAQVLNIPATVNASLSAPEEERPTAFKVYHNGREMAAEELPLQYAARHNVEIRDLEVDVVWENGITVTLLEYAAPLLDDSGQPRGSIGAFLNITDRKRAEQELRESEERYRTLVENFPNGAVLLFDHDLRYVLAAGQALAEDEFNLNNLEGKTIWEALDPELCQLLEPHYRAALAGTSHVVEIPFGNRIYSVHYIPVYDDRGQVTSGMVMSQNITLQKQAEQVLTTARDELEQQVQERTRELQKLTDELQRSNQELEQFAYVASHDLQEPLRAVTSFTQLLAQDYQGQLSEDADTYIEFIVDGATRMQQLIRDLLAYSRTGRYELHLEPVDCNAILERVKQDLQVAIAENQAIITADPLPTITADPGQITNLLQNLIGNSLKYRSEAVPHIHISAKNNIEEGRDDTIQEVSPQSVVKKEWVFSIRDNGIGIEPKYAERIFCIFQRLHTHDEYSGTGLGLAICQKIVERHAGRIWVESQLGQGATFFFTIPI